MRLPPGTWTIVRVDGRGFTKLTKEMVKPFDLEFSLAMRHVAAELIAEFGGVYSYTESDEISLVLPPSFDLFNRSVEKIVSLTAGLSSASFTHRMGLVGTFDSRVWLGSSLGEVVDYLMWRQFDAFRCCVNGYVYHTLRRTMSARQATSQLNTMKSAERLDLLHTHGISLSDMPQWQRRGVAIFYQNVKVPAIDPRTQEDKGFATRRRLWMDTELRHGLPYGDFVRKTIEEDRSW